MDTNAPSDSNAKPEQPLHDANPDGGSTVPPHNAIDAGVPPHADPAGINSIESTPAKSFTGTGSMSNSPVSPMEPRPAFSGSLDDGPEPMAPTTPEPVDMPEPQIAETTVPTPPPAPEPVMPVSSPAERPHLDLSALNDTTPGPTATMPGATMGPTVLPPSNPEGMPMPPASALPPTDTTNQPFSTNQPKRKRKLLGLPIAAMVLVLLVLLGGSAAAYFGYVVPNKPENVWATALSHTGTGYQKLADYANQQKDAKSVTATGTYKVTVQDTVVDGTIDVKAGSKSSETKITAGVAGSRYNLDIVTQQSASSSTPDIYLKADGLDGLSKLMGSPDASGYGSLLKQFNNQWYVIDHTLFDSLTSMVTQGGTAEADKALTAEDFAAINSAVTEVVRSYIFTSDSSKSVLRVSTFVGKDNEDGRSSYHYKVTLDKANTKAMVDALKTKLDDTKLKGTITDDGIKDVKKSIDDIKDTDTADVWVDGSTKIIRKVRFSDSTNDKNYAEMSLNYTGGDSYPFVVKFVSVEKDSPGELTMTATLNTKDNTVTAKIDGEFTGTDPVKVTGNLTAKPSNDDITIPVPTGAKSVNELLGRLYGGTATTQNFTALPSSRFDSDFDF